ncbi:hypothetical protein UA08_03715 [Talaromyces atroroseus]|uniref:PLD phosphodiesterase domain-containing protein n=1 Tax=Talaromyces atroroseus TaxID=1441469 RepID=A0A225B101_TALAT|nr:hypothetical protein UA08_03715 [Talaromyces atroroseus]OKL60936.1 hypothetical protein UA08_03715 [Talaromyces atroroseus]
MISDSLYQLAVSDKSVSSELAQNPKEFPGQIAHRLFSNRKPEAVDESRQSSSHEKGDEAGLQRALNSGKWGEQRPSNLFLKCYLDSLRSLENQPLAGVVSPSLMGSSGVVPLTIVSTLPDINRHTANCIVRAEKEVLLATNFWIHSDASILITNALRELSRRAGERGQKVVVKIIYDRGSVKQVYQNHQRVPPSEWASEKVKLPAPSDIPNIRMEVINYHRPVLGTFHAKFCVIDRKIGLLQSNNVQDNDNLEMMMHLEGPIVDSMYDTFLVCWDKRFDPALPTIGSPASQRPIPSHDSSAVVAETSGSEIIGSSQNQNGILSESTSSDPHYDLDLVEEAKRVNSQVHPRPNETRRDATTRHLNKRTLADKDGSQQSHGQPDGPDITEEDQMTPYIVLPRHDPVPMAMVNREPNGSPGNSNYPVPQNAAWLAGINNAEKSIFIQTPNMNAEPLLEPLLNAVKRGIIVTAYVTLGYNDSGELLPGQNGTNEMIAHRLYSSLSSEEEKSRLRIHNYVAKDRKTPIHNKFKYRSSHVKVMIVDETIAIQDSPLICKIWRDAIERNQNTHKFGHVSSEDGCWHDPETGQIADGTIGPDPGRFSWAKGIVGAVQRVRGAGGF